MNCEACGLSQGVARISLQSVGQASATTQAQGQGHKGPKTRRLCEEQLRDTPPAAGPANLIEMMHFCKTWFACGQRRAFNGPNRRGRTYKEPSTTPQYHLVLELPARPKAREPRGLVKSGPSYHTGKLNQRGLVSGGVVKHQSKCR